MTPNIDTALGLEAQCVLTLLQFVTRCCWSYDWCSDCGARIREDDCHACTRWLDFGDSVEDET